MATANGIFKGRWTIWILSLFFALLAGFGTLMLVGQAAARVDYYVVTDNVAARTQITTANVTAVSAPADSVPPTALTQAEVNSGNYYTKIALSAHTALTDSVVTEGLSSLSADIPKGYVLASLLVSPENAAGGSIKRSDYVDIAAVNGTDSSATSKIVLQHVLVVNVATSADTVANAANPSNGTDANGNNNPGPDNAALYGGIPQMYTFAVTPAEFAQLALLRTASVYLALSSADATSPLDITQSGASMFLPGAVNPSMVDNASTNTSVKAKVEAFATKYAKQGDTLKVSSDGSKLVAYSPQGSTVDTISLEGGKYDVGTGTYTAK